MKQTTRSFSRSMIQGLKPRARRYVLFDGTGLGLRVTPKGTKTWVYVYHHSGRSRYETIGRYPSVGIADARARVAAIRLQLQKGEDPKVRQAEQFTVAELAELYLQKHARAQKATWAEDERILKKDVLPLLGRRQARSLSRKDIIEVIDAVQKRGAGIMANRTLAVMRKMFNFAVEREVIESSPCLGIRTPTRESSREVVLSMGEIRALWRGLVEARVDAGIADTLRLALLTGQRIGEIVAMQWADVDFTESTWTIPAEQTKNRRTHRVPLSSPALKILKHRQQQHAANVWVFPSARGDTHLREASPGQTLRNVRDRIGLPHCRAHDLRRTLATHIGRQEGVDRVLVGKILNHADQSVTAVYDRYDRDEEKRAAIEEWGRRVVDIVNGEE